MRRFLCGLVALGLVFGGVGQAKANLITITTPAVGPITPTNSPDSFSLNAGTNTFDILPGMPTTISFQTGSFAVETSFIFDQTFPFSISENLIINGDTEPILINGQIHVTGFVDTLIIFLGSTESFAGGTLLFTQLPLSVPATTAGDHPFTLQAQIEVIPTISEPSTLLLLGIGTLGLIGYACTCRLAGPRHAEARE